MCTLDESEKCWQSKNKEDVISLQLIKINEKKKNKEEFSWLTTVNCDISFIF